MIKNKKVSFSTFTKVAYILFLIFTTIYVKNVLDEDSFKVTEKEPDKKVVKVKDAKVSLVVQTIDGQKEYSAKLTDGESVQDLLADLRDNTDLYYEIDIYTYGTELISVFGKEPVTGSVWAIFLDDTNITKDISQTKLKDKAVYTIKQIPS